LVECAFSKGKNHVVGTTEQLERSSRSNRKTFDRKCWPEEAYFAERFNCGKKATEAARVRKLIRLSRKRGFIIRRGFRISSGRRRQKSSLESSNWRVVRGNFHGRKTPIRREKRPRFRSFTSQGGKVLSKKLKPWGKHHEERK